MSLKGKVAVVTGAAGEIGEAVAWRLASEGASVLVADLNFECAEKVAKSIKREGLLATPHQVNVTSKQQVQEMMERSETELGGLDILVNLAGILGPNAPFSEIKEEDWDKVIEINLKGIFLCCQAAVPLMVKRGYGRIVNMSSASAKDGNMMLAPYVSSKAAVIALTKSLGKEIAKTGVTVNCVAPTMVEGDLVKGMSDSYFKSLLEKIPMGRLGKKEEVASLVNYLVSEEASFITAQCYDLSGGRSVY